MSTSIIYRKQHPGDPDMVEWGGKSFMHGEAVDFDGRRNDHKPFIEAARGNPFFDVGGEENGDKGNGGKPPKKTDVETPEQYRAYAIDWINRSNSLRELEGRWAGESDLRDKIGWGTDDQHLIDPIYQPRLEKLKQSE